VDELDRSSFNLVKRVTALLVPKKNCANAMKLVRRYTFFVLAAYVLPSTRVTAAIEAPDCQCPSVHDSYVRA
jgi:hypothetical protein